MFWIHRSGLLHINTVPHVHTRELASVLMCCIGMPGHVPHTEWLSVLFIQGTSHKLQTASEHVSPCIKVRIHHVKNWNTTANTQDCLKMIICSCYILNVFITTHQGHSPQLHHNPAHTFHVLMYYTDFFKCNEPCILHGAAASRSDDMSLQQGHKH